MDKLNRRNLILTGAAFVPAMAASTTVLREGLEKEVTAEECTYAINTTDGEVKICVYNNKKERTWHTVPPKSVFFFSGQWRACNPLGSEVNYCKYHGDNNNIMIMTFYEGKEKLNFKDLTNG